MQLNHPLAIGSDGRLAAADPDRHLEQMIEQVLFTTPGERVNRPDFGCGLLALVFEPASTERVAATRSLVRAALLRWLGDLIQLDDVGIEAAETQLVVTVSYTRLGGGGGERRVARFQS